MSFWIKRSSSFSASIKFICVINTIRSLIFRYMRCCDVCFPYIYRWIILLLLDLWCFMLNKRRCKCILCILITILSYIIFSNQSWNSKIVIELCIIALINIFTIFAKNLDSWSCGVIVGGLKLLSKSSKMLLFLSFLSLSKFEVEI